MALRSFFDEYRRQEIRQAVALGRFQARKPAPTPLPLATGHSEIIGELNGAFPPNYTPLSCYDRQLIEAAVHKDLPSALEALENGANPDIRNSEGASVTIIAGATYSRSYGDTPIMIASRRGCLDMVKLLIQFKADVNLDYNTGSCPFPTALSYARKGGFAEIERELIAAGATR
ncbi:ankyrin repeat domain-containing protein [Candidatus Micrarchaeota archaeon]|nr:ankyrin repeat domain-containing protein [Candidatus Micrarchaeota archaeon]